MAEHEVEVRVVRRYDPDDVFRFHQSVSDVDPVDPVP